MHAATWFLKCIKEGAGRSMENTSEGKNQYYTFDSALFEISWIQYNIIICIILVNDSLKNLYTFYSAVETGIT